MQQLGFRIARVQAGSCVELLELVIEERKVRKRRKQEPIEHVEQCSRLLYVTEGDEI